MPRFVLLDSSVKAAYLKTQRPVKAAPILKRHFLAYCVYMFVKALQYSEWTKPLCTSRQCHVFSQYLIVIRLF